MRRIGRRGGQIDAKDMRKALVLLDLLEQCPDEIVAVNLGQRLGPRMTVHASEASTAEKTRNSKQECIEWVKRSPNPFDGESEIEIRQVFEATDCGEVFTPELQEQEQRILQPAAQNAKP